MNTDKTICVSVTDMIRHEIIWFGANYGLEYQAGQLAAHLTIMVNKALESAYAAGISHAELMQLYANKGHDTKAEEDEDEAVNFGMTDEEIENFIMDSYAEAIDDLVDTDATDDYDEF